MAEESKNQAIDEEIEVLGPEDEAEPGKGKETTLVPLGPLQRYLVEIRQYPLLTRGEELRLAKKFAKTRDPNLAWHLVMANLRLVVKIAFEYQRAFMRPWI